MADEARWQDSLPDDIKVNESLGKFKTVADLGKSYISLEKMAGNRFALPTTESKDEEWYSMYDRLGRPKDPKGYKFPSVPAEYNVTDEFKGAISAMAHQLGLNQKQYDNLIAWGMGQSKAITDRQTEIRATLMKGLRDKWGFAANDNQERAIKTISMLCGYDAKHPFVTWLEETGNDKNPVVMEFFFNLSKEFDEDNFVSEQNKKDSTDRQNAHNKINEIMADTKHAYYNENHPGHKAAVAEVARYYQILNDEV